MNLKIETLEIMKKHNKKIKDIDFVCVMRGSVGACLNEYVRINTATFFREANTEYENPYYGYGKDLAISVKVVFKDGTWLERTASEGPEWWEYKKCPTFPLKLGKSSEIWGIWYKVRLL